MRPGPRALVALLPWLLLGLLAAFHPGLLPLWLATSGALTLLAFVDARAAGADGGLVVARTVAPLLPVGVWSPVELRLGHRGDGRQPGRMALLVHDHVPADCDVEGLPRQVELAAGEGVVVPYTLRPRERGDRVFGRPEVWRRSPLGLWERRFRPGDEQPVRVLPNFRPLARYAILAVENRLGEMGIRVTPRRGEGLEFQELRDYRPGDSERQVDWKATCRRQKLTSRVYQEEKDQRLLLWVDCGRRLRARDGEVAHFDQVLNAVLLLTWAAVRRGDAVGLATFAGPQRWVPPLKGRAAMSAILQAVYDLPATGESADYQSAATRLSALQRRRSLVVLISNLRDEDSDDLLPAVRMLARKHLVLVASLRERALREALEKPPSHLEDALLVAAAHDYDEARRRAHERLAGHGVLTLDVEPERLPAALVDRYLDIKRRSLL